MTTTRDPFTLRRAALLCGVAVAAIVFSLGVVGTHATRTAGRARDDGTRDAVFGGADAKKKYPWVARFNGGICCGGSLIGRKVVLTAAHCVVDDIDDEIRPGYDDLLVGAWDLRWFEYPFWNNPLDWTPERHTIERIEVHPLYDGLGPYDVALVFLEQRSKLPPVALATATPAVGADVDLLGWECTDDILQQATLQVRRPQLCGTDPSLELCVGRADEAQHACGGDSGGPYFTKEGGEPAVVGLVSRGPPCPDEWDIATDVSAVRDWIVTEMDPTVTVPPSTACFDVAGWADQDGDTCEWYERNDQRGCPSNGDYGDGITASEACCWCGGGGATSCSDYADFVDPEGDGCDWYEIYDTAGCPSHGTFGSPRTTANDACCWCGGGGGATPETPPPVLWPTPGAPTYPPTLPAPAPTPQPTESDAWTCADSTSWTKRNDDSKTCAWAGELPAARCLVKGEGGVLAAEACLESCGGCAETCADDAAWFKEGAPSKDCVWASRFSNRLAVLGDDGRYGYEACPRAARTCRGAACGDSPSWSKRDAPEKDCAWVAELPAVRCLVKDASAVLAAEACAATCGGCGNACVDDPSWHKADATDKDCVWASRFANRLAAIGEDGRYGYEACRLAARACYGL